MARKAARSSTDLRDVLLYIVAQFAGMLVISLVAVAAEGGGPLVQMTLGGLCLVSAIAIGLAQVRRWLIGDREDDAA